MLTQRFIWSNLAAKESSAAVSSAGSPELRIGLEFAPRISTSLLSFLAFEAACSALPASSGVENVVWAVTVFVAFCELSHEVKLPAAANSMVTNPRDRLRFIEYFLSRFISHS